MPTGHSLTPDAQIELEAALQTAAASRHGLCLRTNDAQRLSQAARKLRAKLGDETLDALRLFISPTAPQTELWLVNGAAELPDKPQPRTDQQT